MLKNGITRELLLVLRVVGGVFARVDAATIILPLLFAVVGVDNIISVNIASSRPLDPLADASAPSSAALCGSCFASRGDRREEGGDFI